jgi:hypothetical protein
MNSSGHFPFRQLMALSAVAALFCASTASAKPAWRDVPPEQLAETKPQLDGDAAAEVIFWNIEVNDTDFPLKRTVTEYIRYKIFAPERAEQVTRLSNVDIVGYYGGATMAARLVHANGRAEEFGKDSIRERALARAGRQAGVLGWLSDTGVAIREKFLAVPGVDAGAVLDFQITRIERPGAVEAFVGQRDGVGIRQFDIRFRLAPPSDQFLNRTFVMNLQGSKLSEDRKNHIVSLTASRLPPIVAEPLVGPATDYALTILHCYEATEIDVSSRAQNVPVPGIVSTKLGAWAPYATLMNWLERDRGAPTKKLKKFAADLTASSPDPEARAQRIFREVQELYLSYVRHAPTGSDLREVESMDDVLDSRSKPDVRISVNEFVWLAVALYQAAGFDAHAVMLPDRALARFDLKSVSPVFLPQLGVAVRVGEAWRVSMPQNPVPLPFGMLPWRHEGQVGLLALERKEQFIEIPATPSGKSQIGTRSELRVQPDGTLSGTVKRRYTGQAAAQLREKLREVDAGKDRDDVVRRSLGLDEKLVEVAVTDVSDFDDPEKPIDVGYQITWANFAVHTKDRLILRPSVFHAENSSPFTASERHHPIHFPFRWQEVDETTIEIPAGFTPESPSAPPSAPGKALHYKIDLGYAREERKIVVRREFVSNILDLPAANYAALKEWYGAVQHSDQHELVFRRAPDAAVERPEAQ